MDSTANILNPKVYEFKLNGKAFKIVEPSLAKLSTFKNEYDSIIKSLDPSLKQIRELQKTFTDLNKKIDELQKKEGLTVEDSEKVAKNSEQLYKIVNELSKLNSEIAELQLKNEYKLFKLVIEPNFTEQDYMSLTPSMKKELNMKIVDITGIKDFLAGNLIMIVQIGQM